MPSILSLIRPHYHTMRGYSSAGMEVSKDDQKTFLNANENPYELDGLGGYNRYPQPQPQKLVLKLANLYGVSPEHLIITRGADEGIALLTRTFIEPHKDSILINPPTFGVYKTYADGMPTKEIVSVPLLKTDKTFKLDVSAIKAALNNDQSPKLIYITNPNNPTGNTFDSADILEIIKAADGKAAVIVDETYAEFKENCSLIKKLEDFPHVVILRTLSKSYALAGVRIGVILSANADLIDTVRTKVMEVYPIPAPCVDAAMSALSDGNLKAAKINIQTLIAERKRMEGFLSNQSFAETLYESDTNFLLVQMSKANEFHTFAASKNVILRNFSSAPMLDNCLRISIGTPEQNDLVMNLMKEFYQISP